MPIKAVAALTILSLLFFTPSVNAQIREDSLDFDHTYTGSPGVSHDSALKLFKDEAIASAKERLNQTAIVNLIYRKIDAICRTYDKLDPVSNIWIRETKEDFKDEYYRETITLDLVNYSAVILKENGDIQDDVNSIPYGSNTHYKMTAKVRVKATWDESNYEREIRNIIENFNFSEVEIISRNGCRFRLNNNDEESLTKGMSFSKIMRVGVRHTISAIEFTGCDNTWRDTTFTLERDKRLSIEIPWWDDPLYAYIQGGHLQIEDIVFCVSDFEIMRREVTFSDYKKFLDATHHPAPFNPNDWAKPYLWPNGTPNDSLLNRPVVLVSKDDACAYCEWLTRETGVEYRLPTYVEWRYAAREEIQSYQHGNQRRGWFSDNSDGFVHSAEQTWANSAGICDLFGNVKEWLMDHWFPSYNELPRDGTAYQDDPRRSWGQIVGGSWADSRTTNTEDYLNQKHRQDGNSIKVGFRVVRELQ